MRLYDRRRRCEYRPGGHVRGNDDVEPDHDVVAHAYRSEDAPPAGHVHSVPQLRRPSAFTAAARRDEGIVPQIAVRPEDTVATDKDAAEMGHVEARTNMSCRRDRYTRENFDRPFCQFA